MGSDVSGMRLGGRLRMGLINGAKRALNWRRMSVKQGGMIMCARSEWTTVLNA